MALGRRSVSGCRSRRSIAAKDGGYLWRLNSYWRFLGRDGGTYVQCESVSLTRGIPLGFGWLIRPFVTSLPRESLEFTLDTTRLALTRSLRTRQTPCYRSRDASRQTRSRRSGGRDGGKNRT